MSDEMLFPLALIIAGIAIFIVGFWWQWRRAPREDEEAGSVPVPSGREVSEPVTKEVYREREIVREIVKIRCRHCGSLFEERLDICPRCGAPS